MNPFLLLVYLFAVRRGGGGRGDRYSECYTWVGLFRAEIYGRPFLQIIVAILVALRKLLFFKFDLKPKKKIMKKKNLIKLSPKFETGSEKRKHICYDMSHNALAIDLTTVGVSTDIRDRR